MSESLIDMRRERRYDLSIDYISSPEQSIKAHREMILFERREWHRLHDEPEPGYGLDGYPLQRGKPSGNHQHG